MFEDFNSKWTEILNIWKEIYGEAVDGDCGTGAQALKQDFERTLGESYRFCVDEFERMNKVSCDYRQVVLKRIEMLNASTNYLVYVIKLVLPRLTLQGFPII